MALFGFLEEILPNNRQRRDIEQTGELIREQTGWSLGTGSAQSGEDAKDRRFEEREVKSRGNIEEQEWKISEGSKDRELESEINARDRAAVRAQMEGNGQLVANSHEPHIVDQSRGTASSGRGPDIVEQPDGVSGGRRNNGRAQAPAGRHEPGVDFTFVEGGTYQSPGEPERTRGGNSAAATQDANLSSPQTIPAGDGDLTPQEVNDGLQSLKFSNEEIMQVGRNLNFLYPEGVNGQHRLFDESGAIIVENHAENFAEMFEHYAKAKFGDDISALEHPATRQEAYTNVIAAMNQDVTAKDREIANGQTVFEEPRPIQGNGQHAPNGQQQPMDRANNPHIIAPEDRAERLAQLKEHAGSSRFTVDPASPEHATQPSDPSMAATYSIAPNLQQINIGELNVNVNGEIISEAPPAPKVVEINEENIDQITAHMTKDENLTMIRDLRERGFETGRGYKADLLDFVNVMQEQPGTDQGALRDYLDQAGKGEGVSERTAGKAADFLVSNARANAQGEVRNEPGRQDNDPEMNRMASLDIGELSANLSFDAVARDVSLQPLQTGMNGQQGSIVER